MFRVVDRVLPALEGLTLFLQLCTDRNAAFRQIATRDASRHNFYRRVSRGRFSLFLLSLFCFFIFRALSPIFGARLASSHRIFGTSGAIQFRARPSHAGVKNSITALFLHNG
jgi:hypothetical protein